MLFVWIIILGLLQSVAQLNINFLGLFAILAGLKKGPIWGLCIGIFIGSLSEVLSSSNQGLNLTLYSGLGLGAGLIKQKLYYKESSGQKIVFSFFGMLCFYMAHFAFTRTINTDVLFAIILSSIIAPLLFRIIE